MNLLVLVHSEFNDMELVDVLSVLNRTKDVNITFYNPESKEATGQHGIVSLKLVNKFKLNNFDAIFIPGGKGANFLRKDEKALNVIREFKENNKYIFAICDAPNVLYENDIITSENTYVSYPIENLLAGKNRRVAYACADKKIITGKCPAAALTLGLLIIKVVFGDKLYEQIKNDVYGNHEK
ncbi:DJ-1/PfpI family protein [Mycoplasmopsis felifaucium]|uniref:DJ-1/PfpI family protein n=1 Tax=Mycoplasmopsis felifaucium TaxID=35768 RepID=A0ABZ2RQC7_9BACT